MQLLSISVSSTNHIFVNELHISLLTGIARFELIQTASKIKEYVAYLSGPDLG